jgi:6-phosphogluconolactonase
MNSQPHKDLAQPLFRGFRNAQDMFTVLADEITGRLAASAARGASMVISGGTTPGDLYDVLAERSFYWNRVEITLSDERWCDTSSDRSNEKLARSRLLVDRATKAELVPLKTALAHAREAEAEVNAAIAAMPRPFDVVLLGMGTDGHTASLIPGSDGLARAMDASDPALVRAVHPPDLTNMGERMTLTLRALLDSRAIFLLIRGDAKLEAYKHALSGRDILEAPVRAVLHQNSVPVSVFWSE